MRKRIIKKIGTKVKEKITKVVKKNTSAMKTTVQTVKKKVNIKTQKTKGEKKDLAKLGTEFSTTKIFGKPMLMTGVNLLEHYIAVWEGVKKRRDELQNHKGFTFWGNNKNKKKRDPVRREQILVKGNMIETRQSQARALVATNDEVIVISFRGSGVQKDPEANWARVRKTVGTVKNGIADVRISLHEEAGYPGRVHYGFFKEYTNINQIVIKALKKCRDYKNKQIYVTGFSLGSAMGALCLWELNRMKDELGIKKDIIGYLFACPSPGDKIFNREFKKLSNVYTFAHEKDPVPQLLHGIFKNYEAPGNKMFVFETGRSMNKEKCHQKAEQVKLKDIKIRINPKRFAVLSKLKLSGVNWVLICKNFLIPFAKIHNGPVYQRCLLAIVEDYKKRTDSKTTMSKTAKKYNDEGAKHALWSDYLKKES